MLMVLLQRIGHALIVNTVEEDLSVQHDYYYTVVVVVVA